MIRQFINQAKVEEAGEKNMAVNRLRIENAGNMRMKISELCEFVRLSKFVNILRHLDRSGML
jgi:hypothetical protein